MKKGEEFAEAEFFTKITRFGEVREGTKKLTVVTYLSEGNVLVWDGKKLRDTNIIGEGEEGEGADNGYKEPTTESWVRFKTKSGATGWAKLPPKDGKELNYGWCG